MNCYRSTAIAAADHCPAAVDFAQNPEGPRAPLGIVARGVAAHAYLQAATERPDLTPPDLAAAVAARLIAEGRIFDGRPDGPFPPALVWEGIELAAAYAVGADLAGGQAEVRIMARADWKMTDDPATARITATIDHLRGGEWLEITEYKTAWSAGRTWLDGWQARAQVAIAWAMVEADPRIRGLVITLVNLRTGERYDREFDRHADVARLAEIRRQLTVTMTALDRMAASGRRPKIPGPGCSGCLYWATCAPSPPGGMGPEHWAATWAAARIAAREAARHVRQLADDGPIEVPGGWLVGLRERTRLIVRRDAAVRVAAAIPGLDAAERAAWASALSSHGVGVAGLRRLGEAHGVDLVAIATEVKIGKTLAAWRSDVDDRRDRSHGPGGTDPADGLG